MVSVFPEIHGVLLGIREKMALIRYIGVRFSTCLLRSRYVVIKRGTMGTIGALFTGSMTSYEAACIG